MIETLKSIGEVAFIAVISMLMFYIICVFSYLSSDILTSFIKKIKHGKNIKTNADRIRSMSDEELAVYLTDDVFCCNDCSSGQENSDNPFGEKCDEKCFEHCLAWLKQQPKK